MSYDHKRAEHVRNVSSFNEAYRDADGIWRWQSNHQIPFADMFASWVEEGLLPGGAAIKAAAKRKEETAAFMQRYAEAQAARTPEQLAEERAEMLAAFGPGETVVNVLTGRKTTL